MIMKSYAWSLGTINGGMIINFQLRSDNKMLQHEPPNILNPNMWRHEEHILRFILYAPLCESQWRHGKHILQFIVYILDKLVSPKMRRMPLKQTFENCSPLEGAREKAAAQYYGLAHNGPLHNAIWFSRATQHQGEAEKMVKICQPGFLPWYEAFMRKLSY